MIIFEDYELNKIIKKNRTVIRMHKNVCEFVFIPKKSHSSN